MKKLRVAIIGQGRSGRDIHGAFFKNEISKDRFEVVAVVDAIDVRRDRAKEEYQCDVYADYHDLLGRDDIDLVVNSTINHMHKDITIDETFTYDIHAYVTKDAKKVVITDVLEPYLQFTSTRDGADWYVWDLGKNNNEKVKNDKDGKAIAANSDATVALARGATNGEDTVTGLGTNALRSITTVDEGVAEKQKLTVTIENAANVGGRDVRGHWIKVRFDVKIKDGYTYDTLKNEFITIDPEGADAVEDRAEPNIANQPLDSVENHTGLPNKASYSIDTAAKVNQYNDTSNTVTVKPEQVTTWVKKQWENADGTPMTTWPTGKTVTFKVSYGSTAANTKTTTITVDSLDAVESNNSSETDRY